MPTGCAGALAETQTPTEWFLDPWASAQSADAATCTGRLATYNAYCVKNDGQHDWRTEDAPPRIVGGKFSASAGATDCNIYKLGSTGQSCNDVCWSLGRSCNLEATRNLNTEQLVRGVLGKLGHSIPANAQWRTDDCVNSGWEGQIPFISHDGIENIEGRCGPTFGKCGGGGASPVPASAVYCNEANGWCGDTNAHRDAQPSSTYDFVANSRVNAYYFCPGAASSKTTCAGKHNQRERICACGGTTSALDRYPATYLAATAGSWDQSANMFQDISGNRRVGRVAAGSTSTGVLAANGAGAGISVPFVGGTTSTQILWGQLSVPSTFTICSITR